MMQHQQDQNHGERLASLESDVRNGFKAMGDQLSEIQQDVKDIKINQAKSETRISQLELSQADQRGFVRALSFLAGIPAFALVILSIVLAVRELS